MARLLLMRHGATAWTAAGRFQGQTDVPLSTVGQQQVAALAQRLSTETLQCVYASDLQRAWETAQAIASRQSLTLHAEPRLREIAFGGWEGSTYGELQQRDPERLAAWERDPLQVPPPGGETLGQLTERVRAVYTALCALPQDMSIGLVAHGGPLQVLLCLALGLPALAYWQFAMAPASLSELCVYRQGAILTRLNDTHHLAAAP
ncbi:MAG: histidine phosphatase family protein [Candidatus Tectimicrobiota bacterium]